MAVRNSAAYPHLLDAPLLRGLRRERKATFLDACIHRHHPDPTDLLRQGEPAPGLYLVARGAVEVSYADESGNVKIAHVAGAGEVLGEVEALSGDECAATCRSLPDATSLLCPPPLVEEMVTVRTFVRNVASIFRERLQRHNVQRFADHFHGVDRRLCMYLLRMSAPDRPELRLSQSALAAMIGASRQTVNRRLSELRGMGAVRVGRGSIRVIDRLVLAREAGELDQSNDCALET
jgi:CRP-like cAMP-binding protein